MINNKLNYQKFFHLLMIVFSLISSLIIITSDQFDYGLLIIITIYFCYLFIFKVNLLANSTSNGSKMKVHRIQETDMDKNSPFNFSMRGKNKLSTSFLQGLDQRLERESSKFISMDLSKSGFQDKSFLDKSSLPLKLSMSKSRIQNSNELKMKSSGKQLSQRFKIPEVQPQNEKLQRSAVNIEPEDEENDAQRELMKSCMQRHKETCKKINKKFKDSYPRVKKVMDRFCRQTYKDNLQNMKKLIYFVEEKFLVRVDYSEFNEMQIERKESEYESYVQRVELEDLFSVLFNCSNFKFPWKFKNKKVVESLFSNNQLYAPKKSLTDFQKKELKVLITQRFKLDEYFDCTKTSLKSSQRLMYLKYLKKYLNDDIRKREYEFEDVLHIREEASKQNRVVLNVTITKLNQLISVKQKELNLLYDHNNSWFGFFRQGPHSHFRIQTTVGVDYGHPHFDLKYCPLKEKEEIYYCQYGLKNNVSLIYMYLWVLKDKLQEKVHEDMELEKVMQEIIDF